MSVKITVEISEENNKDLRRACYLLEGKKKKELVNEALKIGLDIILARAEKKEG